MTSLTSTNVTLGDRAAEAGKAVLGKLDQAARHIDEKTSTAFTNAITLATSLSTSVRKGLNITDDWLKRAPGKAGKRMGFVSVLDVVTGPVIAAKYGISAAEAHKVGAVRQTVMRGFQATSHTLKSALGVMFVASGVMSLADTLRIVHLSTTALSKAAGMLGVIKMLFGTLPKLYKLWVTFDLYKQSTPDSVQMYRDRLRVDVNAIHAKCKFDQALSTKDFVAIRKKTSDIQLTDEEKAQIRDLDLDWEKKRILYRDVVYAKRANALDLKCALGTRGFEMLKASTGTNDAELATQLQEHMKFRVLKTGFVIMLDVLAFIGIGLAFIAGFVALGPWVGVVATILWIFSSVAGTGLDIRRYFKTRGRSASYDKYIFLTATVVFSIAVAAAMIVSGSWIVGLTMAGLGTVMLLILLDTYACSKGFDVFAKMRECATALKHESAE